MNKKGVPAPGLRITYKKPSPLSAIAFKIKAAYTLGTGRVDLISFRCHETFGDWFEVHIDNNDTYHLVEKHLWRDDKLLGLGPLSFLDRIRIGLQFEPITLATEFKATVEFYDDGELILTCGSPRLKSLSYFLRNF